MALETPRRDRRVVHRAVQGEIQLHVPLQAIEHRPGSTEPEVRGQLIGDGVGEDIPVAGRRLRVRAIGPELRDRAIEVTAPDDLC